MKKIVFLGCENSHANTFLGFIKNNPKFMEYKAARKARREYKKAQKAAKKNPSENAEEK